MLDYVNSGDQSVAVSDLENSVSGTPCAVDHLFSVNHKTGVDRAPIIDRILTDHRQNRAAIKMKVRLDLMADSRVASLMGFYPGLTEAERASIMKRKKAMLSSLKSGVAPLEDADIFVLAAPFHDVAIEAKRPIEKMIAAYTRQIERDVKSLEIRAFIESVRGIGFAGVGALIGEAGADLSNFPTHQHLWKRLGLAVMDGYSQGRFAAGSSPTADDYIRHGYNGARRSIVRSCVGTPLMMCGEKNPYRGDFDAYKARITAINAEGGYDHRGGPLSKAHINNMAMRYMEKAFVRDLWKAWKAAYGCVSRDTRMQEAG